MKLSEEESRKYYTEVAKSLIKDGVTGWSVEELTEDLMNDPDNPFQPLSEKEILQKLEESEQQIREGKGIPAEEAFAELEKKIRLRQGSENKKLNNGKK